MIASLLIGIPAITWAIGGGGEGAPWLLVLAGVGVVFFFSILWFWASRYVRCPSDRILVVYGRTRSGQAANCIHGGGVFVWPLIQDYRFLSLTPMTISIPLQGALSFQNIRINVPSTFTVGVSTQPAIMSNAAERLLGLGQGDIETMVKEIIFGQLRLTVASLTIEQINQDREKFLEAIRRNVEPELNKVGLFLINVNITDITDEADYIGSIGKKAASEAVNKAKIDVAEQEKIGAIGESQATREMDIRVAENVAQAEKGKKQAEADKRVFVQQQETSAAIGESDAMREKEIRVAENAATAEKGRKQAEADKRVYVQEKEALAVSGENKSRALIAQSQAEYEVALAESKKRGDVAKFEAEAEIQKSQAKAELQRLNAVEVVREETEKAKIVIAAQAQAEKERTVAQGHADAILKEYMASAEGTKAVLAAKALGYQSLIESCGGDAKAAATLLMVEKIEEMVKLQVEAIKNIKIDKVTVWDSGSNGKSGNGAAEFLSGMAKSLPPLHDVAAMAGIDLPQFLGKVSAEQTSTANSTTLK